MTTRLLTHNRAKKNTKHIAKSKAKFFNENQEDFYFMKDIIITVGLILLGVIVFTLIMGGDGSLRAHTQDFFQNMANNFSAINTMGTDTAATLVPLP